jgi:hypothetical protein
MFTIEEKKQLRSLFWSKFKTYSNKRKLKNKMTGKWIMDQTGIKQLKLKFHFDQWYAWAGIEVDSRNLEKRIDLFDKLEKLKAILEEKVPHPLIWELEQKVNERKTVSRICSEKDGVNIYNQDDWKETMVFLYEVMEPIEDVFREYSDYLKYQ